MSEELRVEPGEDPARYAARVLGRFEALVRLRLPHDPLRASEAQRCAKQAMGLLATLGMVTPPRVVEAAPYQYRTHDVEWVLTPAGQHWHRFINQDPAVRSALSDLLARVDQLRHGRIA